MRELLLPGDGVMAGGTTGVGSLGLWCLRLGLACDPASGMWATIGSGKYSCPGGEATKNAVGHDSLCPSAGSHGRSGAAIEALSKASFKLW